MNTYKEPQLVEQMSTENYDDILMQQRLHVEAKRRKRKKKARMMTIAYLCLVMVIAFSLVLICLLPEEEHDYSASVVSQNGNSKTVKDADSADVIPGEEVSDDNDEELAEDDSAGDFKKSEYAILSYATEDNWDRYEAYHALNPTMNVDDVVWRVNANLDKPKYEYDIAATGYDDPYIIVNKYYTVPDDYKPDDLTDVDGQLLREDTANAFRKMREAAATQGLKITAVSGYRTVDYQRGLYESYLASDSKENVDRYSARPGYSEHHTGMAVDVFGSVDGLRQFETTPEYVWVKEHGREYGFIIRYLAETEDITGYESEPWHLRYVGVDVSQDMYKKGINSFEEYIAKGYHKKFY